MMSRHDRQAPHGEDWGGKSRRGKHEVRTGRVKCEVVTELCGEIREIVGYVSLEFRGLAEDRR